MQVPNSQQDTSGEIALCILTMENSKSCKAEIILNKDYSSFLDFYPQRNLWSLIPSESKCIVF